MNLADRIATITMDELTAAFKESQLRFTQRYGLFHALQIPFVRRSLEIHALEMRKKKQQHGTPAPTMQAETGA